jgi:hypothetical protein
MIRRCVAALVIVSLLVVPQAGHAASWQTVDCSSNGFTLQVPADWTAIACVHLYDRMVASSPGIVSQIIATVERHGFWNDSRAHSSIYNDLGYGSAGNGVTYTKPQFSILVINGRRYMAGVNAVHISFPPATPITVVRYELETFVKGYMYKFRATISVKGNDTRLFTAQQQILFECLDSIRVTGPQ